MQRPDNKLLQKYFDGSATKSEAEIVLDWFETKEGIKYIEKSFETEEKPGEKSFESLERQKNVLRSINHQIKGDSSAYGFRTRYPYRLVAVTILVLISALYLLVLFITLPGQPQTVKYATGPSETESIILSDGTNIQLSENSLIEITERDQKENTVAYLEGQAYFDVVNQKNRQFTIFSSGTEISVLGTSFNVNTLSSRREVLVAVSNGTVSFRDINQAEGNEVILTGGMIGLFNNKTGELRYESTDVHNYLSWMHKSITFNSTSFENVLTQLERVFEITNEIESEELLNLKLTANFKRGTVDQVLNTISEGLGINYDYQNGGVRWATKSLTKTNHYKDE